MIYTIVKERALELAEKYSLLDSNITITGKILSNEEAIGNPEHKDYPLLKGKERLMDADFSGSHGVAYSDMCGCFQGTISEILNLSLDNSFYRAVFISTINAMLKHLKLINNTVHCRNDGPVICADHLLTELNGIDDDTKFVLIGFQPRFAEVLTENFNTKIIDLDPDNIGKKVNGVEVLGEDYTNNVLNWADVIFATSSTFVNGTASKFILPNKRTIFYGVSGAGLTYLLNLERYCFQA